MAALRGHQKADCLADHWAVMRAGQWVVLAQMKVAQRVDYWVGMKAGR